MSLAVLMTPNRFAGEIHGSEGYAKENAWWLIV